MVLKRQKVLFYNVSNFKCFVSVIYHLFKNSFLTPLCFFPCPSVSSSLNWLVLHVTQSYTIASHYFISLFILHTAAQTAEYNHIIHNLQ